MDDEFWEKFKKLIGLYRRLNSFTIHIENGYLGYLAKATLSDNDDIESTIYVFIWNSEKNKHDLWAVFKKTRNLDTAIEDAEFTLNQKPNLYFIQENRSKLMLKIGEEEWLLE